MCTCDYHSFPLHVQRNIMLPIFVEFKSIRGKRIPAILKCGDAYNGKIYFNDRKVCPSYIEATKHALKICNEENTKLSNEKHNQFRAVDFWYVNIQGKDVRLSELSKHAFIPSTRTINFKNATCLFNAEDVTKMNQQHDTNKLNMDDNLKPKKRVLPIIVKSITSKSLLKRPKTEQSESYVEDEDEEDDETCIWHPTDEIWSTINLQDFLKQNNNDYVLTSSLILEMFGLRNAKDVDYIHKNDNKLQFSYMIYTY